MATYPAFRVDLPPSLKAELGLAPDAVLVVIDRTSGQVDPSPDAYLSAGQLAQRFGLNTESVRKKLSRWQAENDEGWLETTNRRRNEPRFLYRLEAVEEMLRKAA